MISGSARLVYALERLLLLTFGIAMGVEVAGLPPGSDQGGVTLGAVGTLARRARCSVSVTTRLVTPAHLVLAAVRPLRRVRRAGGLEPGPRPSRRHFVAGAVVLPVAYAVQTRRSGPPVPVTFLPALSLLVPGALGLEGVAKLVAADDAGGLGDFLTPCSRSSPSQSASSSAPACPNGWVA